VVGNAKLVSPTAENGVATASLPPLVVGIVIAFAGAPVLLGLGETQLLRCAH